MTNWNDVTAAAPDLAKLVQTAFERTGLALLATLRADGSPRIAGIEPMFWDGDVWLGMMWGSRKARDLQRDPRCALHAATVDKEVKEGDAKISARAVAADEDEIKRAAGAAFAGDAGVDPNDRSPWHLFRLDVTEVHHLAPGGDRLFIRWWTPAGGEHLVERQ